MLFNNGAENVRLPPGLTAFYWAVAAGHHYRRQVNAALLTLAELEPIITTNAPGSQAYCSWWL
jgi:hypothetical protein